MTASLRAAFVKTDPTPVADPGLATLALTQLPDDVALLRPDLSVEWINDPFSQRLGLPANACRNLNWLALHPTAAIHELDYRRACGGETVVLAPFPAPGPDELVAYSATLQPLLRDGVVVGLLVTEREAATPASAQDRELLRSRERFSQALESAQLGFYEWDVQADTLTGLDAWCALFGLPPDTGRAGHDARWESRVHPDDLAGMLRAYDEHFAGQSVHCEIEYRLRTGDDQWMWVFDRSQVTARAPDGTPLRITGACMRIDQRKRTELALRDSEMRFAAAVWGVGFGLWELDVSTLRARWFSDWCETEDLHPCEGPDHVGLWDSHIHPDDLPRAARQFSDLLENRHDIYEAEYRIRTRSNEWHWIMERCRAAERGADGRPLRVVGICMNIHARKLSEMALRDSQLHLRSIAENTSDWLTLVDPQQRVLFMNRPLGHLTPQQVTGSLLREVLPSTHAGVLSDFVGDVIAEQARTELEVVAHDPQLGARHLLLRARPVRAEGRIVGVVITTTDITQQRHHEQQLQLQARILETMREGVVLVDGDNRIRLTNPAFDQIFGSAPAGLVGQSIEPLFGMGDAVSPAADRRIREQLTARRAEPFEFECARPDGSTFAAACVMTPLVVDGHDHWLAVLNDVTDRRVLEREILEVSNREQQRIGNDLHDGLGQELTGVAMMLRGLATRIRSSQPQALPEIDGIIRLLGQSIHNARTLARGLSPVSLERGGLLPALRLLATRARESYGLAVTLRTRSALPMRLDESSANHLYRIVQEALNNALRHGRATRVKIQVTVDEHLIRISLHDNGRGLPARGAPQTGLGLRTMRYRASVVGGDLLVANHRLGGTVVRCVCPQGAREPQSLDLARVRAHARAHARAHTEWQGSTQHDDDFK
jgi:PAS domain S-box-containing protein